MSQTTVSDARPSPPRRSPWSRVGVVLGGQGVSLIGDQVFFIAAVWAAAQMGGTTAVTLVTLAESVPRALAMIFGGVLCDALGPRVVLLRTTSVRIAVLAVATVIALTSPSVWLLVVVAALEGALLGLGTPSFGTLMPRMVDGEQLGRANSVRTMVARFAPIVGSPFGAWLVAEGQLPVALGVVTVGCVVALLCLAPVTKEISAPTGAPSGVPMWKRTGDGLKLLRSDRKLRLLFLSALCLDFAFAWPMNPGLPVLVIDRGWAVSAVGLVIACWAGGALAGAGISAVVGERVPLSIRLVGSGIGIGVLLVGMVLAPSLAVMAVLSAALGVCSGLNGPAAVTLYQKAAPADRLGTAMAMLALAGIGCAPFAYALSGALAGLTSPELAWAVTALVAFGGPITAARALRIPSA
ncbi:MFS transporter [Lentzea sp. CC55]|uniref:MFS transporter n=1 Tax=Lentzea sp. CC55 TaxID=2884909 RepID=UPI001F44CC29|nr:MFS transporter [Lentzea sp. CC55]MCG8925200.1 MFS transporter [Lentzea sp. CC55]